MAYDERMWREMLQVYITQHPEEADEALRIKPHLPTLTLDQHFLLHYRTPALEFERVAGGAPGSLWVTIAEHNLFFAGDTIIVDEPALLERTPDSKAWLNTLSHLARRTTMRHIVPGRGKSPIQHSDIETQREFMRVSAAPHGRWQEQQLPSDPMRAGFRAGFLQCPGSESRQAHQGRPGAPVTESTRRRRHWAKRGRVGNSELRVASYELRMVW